MITPVNTKGPAAEAEPDPSPKEIAHHHNPRSSIAVAHDDAADKVPQNDKWALDLQRRVGRAARDTAYYTSARLLASHWRVSGCTNCLLGRGRLLAHVAHILKMAPHRFSDVASLLRVFEQISVRRAIVGRTR